MHEITADCCLSALLIVPTEGWVEERTCVLLWTYSVVDEGRAKLWVVVAAAIPEPTFTLVLHSPACYPGLTVGTFMLALCFWWNILMIHLHFYGGCVDAVCQFLWC